VDAETVFEITKLDKKRQGSSVPFVLVGAPGEVTQGHAVPEADLRLAIEELIV
jgi:3-dehydroquinate synthetase